MKRKIALAMAAALVLTTALAGCGSKAEDTKSDDSAKDNKKTEAVSEEKSEGDSFTVGFDASFPPYGYKDEEGEYVGFDLDLAQEVCDRNGYKY